MSTWTLRVLRPRVQGLGLRGFIAWRLRVRRHGTLQILQRMLRIIMGRSCVVLCLEAIILGVVL